ncbi:MAG: B12-binding domain-containing radical SAM protein [Magnetococcales bacterium]|nr:B12-binding domain-containing radical SAM protein [Magnetococcales bacterium]
MTVSKKKIFADERLTAEKLQAERARRKVKHLVGVVANVQAESHSQPKAVLVRPPIVAVQRAINNEAVPAVGLAYILAFAKSRGYEVKLIDAIASRLNRIWPLDDVPGYICKGLTFDEIIADIDPDTEVIGFSIMFSGEWPAHRRLIKMVGEKFPQALLLAGGEHITALSEFSLRDCPELDFCVHGEGEMTFVDILDGLRLGKDLRELEGVAYLDKDGSYCTGGGLPRIRDIDNLPWPHWPDGYLENFWDAGKSYGIQSFRDMPMMASRGCPFRCTFCSNSQMWTTRYILRDVEDVIWEIKHWLAKYQITAIQFYDLTAITKKSWAMEFCRRLKEENLNINWSLPSGTRSEILDFETLSNFKDTGCNYLVYAPETGSARTLKAIKKRVDLKNMDDSIRAAKRAGLVIRTNLIIGFPGETRVDVFHTVVYGLKLAFWGADEVSINIFSPYPGTEIFADLIASGELVVSDDYLLGLTSLNSDYTAFNPITCNKNMSAFEMACYRLGFMMINYILGYLFYPKRIFRTLRNIFSDHHAATVLEHRLKDVIAGWRKKEK